MLTCCIYEQVFHLCLAFEVSCTVKNETYGESPAILVRIECCKQDSDNHCKQKLLKEHTDVTWY